MSSAELWARAEEAMRGLYWKCSPNRSRHRLRLFRRFLQYCHEANAAEQREETQ